MAKKRHPLHGTYQHLLGPKENLRSVYTLGLHTLLLTDKRVILKRNISHNLITFSYKEIEAVEYVTVLKWISLIVSFLLFVISYVFFTMMKVEDSMTLRFQGAQVVASEGGVTSTPVLYNLIAFITLTLAFVMMFHFILSMFGKVRIVLEGQRKPVDIMAKFNEDVPKILNEIERT